MQAAKPKRSEAFLKFVQGQLDDIKPEAEYSPSPARQAEWLADMAQSDLETGETLRQIAVQIRTAVHDRKDCEYKEKLYRRVRNLVGDNFYAQTSVMFVAAWRHIMISELREKLTVCARELFELITEAMERQDIVVFSVSQIMAKSNIWICSQISKHLVELIEELDKRGQFFLVQDKNSAKTVCEFARSVGSGRCMAVEFDDMAYSGTQIRDDTVAGIWAGAGDNVTLYLAIPYITKFARERITLGAQKYDVRVEFLKETEDIQRIGDYVERFFRCEEYEEVSFGKAFYDMFWERAKKPNRDFKRCFFQKSASRDTSLPVVTFQHKIADKYSIPQIACIVGRNPHNAKLVFFFEDCARQNAALGELYMDLADDQPDLQEVETITSHADIPYRMCPPALYKKSQFVKMHGYKTLFEMLDYVAAPQTKM